MSRWDRRLALGSFALGLVLLLTAAAQFLIDHQMSQGLSFALIGGIALLVLGAVIDPRALAELSGDRRARFGSLSVLISAAMIGVLVLVNLIASRSLAYADLTRAGYYTLSGQTIAVLGRLDSPLTITGFYRPTPAEVADRHDAETLLAEYRVKSDRVVVHMLDADFNFHLAQQLGVTISASIALQYKNKRPVVLTLGSQTEQDITSAILKLESNRTPEICWATGDGERDIRSRDVVDGYTAAAGALDTNNYKVVEVALGTVAAVPAECDILAVVGPTRALSGNGPAVVSDYLSKGGKVYLAADPLPQDPKLVPSLNSIIKPYHLAYSGGLVIDADPNHQAANDVTTPVVFNYGGSPISKELSGRFTYFPQTTSITGTVDPAVASVQLVVTTPNSYEVAAGRQKLDRLPSDRVGPFVLMETVEQKQDQGKLSRLVLVGTSSLAENRTLPPNDLSGGSNLQLFLSSLDWLSQQEDLISVPPKPLRSVPIPVTEADKTLNLLVTLVLLPLVVAGLGLYVWLRRRRDLRP